MGIAGSNGAYCRGAMGIAGSAGAHRPGPHPLNPTPVGAQWELPVTMAPTDQGLALRFSPVTLKSRPLLGTKSSICAPADPVAVARRLSVRDSGPCNSHCASTLEHDPVSPCEARLF